jgi:hypothetical protein
MKNSVLKESPMWEFWFSFYTKMNSNNFIWITSQSRSIFHDNAPTNIFYVQHRPNTGVSIYNAANVDSYRAKTVHSNHVRSGLN